MAWLPFFNAVDAFGFHQWAYQKGRGSKDLLALLVALWLQAWSMGLKIGLFMSDVVGAFDHVDSRILVRRCEALGMQGVWAQLLSSMLAPRKAEVVVAGFKSPPFSIQNSVYQGTVLGPPLWNVFFKPAARIVRSTGLDPFAFADDLNAMGLFPNSMANEAVMDNLSACQESLHEWGRSERLRFDAGKEHSFILSRRSPVGDVFKLLGVVFDCKLIMSVAVHSAATKAGAKLRALLRARRYYSTADLFNQYKAHVLSLLEFPTAAIYHASNSVLDGIDSVQRRFLRELQITAKDSFLNFGLAPLQLRRDIAMLGLLHKVVLGQAHSGFSSLFPPCPSDPPRYFTRLQARKHSRQLLDRCDGRQPGYLGRSLFGLVRVYNSLPQEAVEKSSVSSFQTFLTKIAKSKCENDSDNWEHVFSSPWR